MTEPGLLYLTTLGQVSERARELDLSSPRRGPSNGELLEVLVHAIGAEQHDELQQAREAFVDLAALLLLRIVGQDRRYP